MVLISAYEFSQKYFKIWMTLHTHTHTNKMEHYSAKTIKRNCPFAITWKDLNVITLTGMVSEVHKYSLRMTETQILRDIAYM